jgi:S-adenosylmethionine/arginine decarboxylase-like enzyme
MTGGPMSYSHAFAELSGIADPRLADEGALAALAVAAGGAIGLTPHGPPLARTGPRGIAVSLLGHGGHIVIHATPDAGRCLVDILAPAPGLPERGLEVLARRLGGAVSQVA